jgi:hypothetical protein
MKMMKAFRMADMPKDIKALWDDYACDCGNRGYLSVWVNDEMRLNEDNSPSNYAHLAAWLIEQGAGEDEHILVEYDW